MKKVKIKRKRNTNIFSTRSLLLIFIAIIVFSSSAYAIFQESLTITGTVSGNLENYTYYFKAPSGWGNTMNAYYWNSSDTSTMSWPGVAMTEHDSNNSIYKIDIPTSTNFDYIIFNDGTNQTANIQIDKASNNNQLFTCQNSNGRQALAFNRFSDWPGTRVFVYLWNSTTGVNNGAFPGQEITSNLISINLYAIDVTQNTYDYVIFSNGGSLVYDSSQKSNRRQTGDLQITSTGDLRYDGTWHSLTLLPGYWGGWDTYETYHAINLSPTHIHP